MYFIHWCGVTLCAAIRLLRRRGERKRSKCDVDDDDKYFVIVRFAAKWHSSHKFMVHIDPGPAPTKSEPESQVAIPSHTRPRSLHTHIRTDNAFVASYSWCRALGAHIFLICFLRSAAVAFPIPFISRYLFVFSVAALSADK